MNGTPGLFEICGVQGDNAFDDLYRPYFQPERPVRIAGGRRAGSTIKKGNLAYLRPVWFHRRVQALDEKTVNIGVGLFANEKCRASPMPRANPVPPVDGVRWMGGHVLTTYA